MSDLFASTWLLNNFSHQRGPLCPAHTMGSWRVMNDWTVDKEWAAVFPLHPSFHCAIYCHQTLLLFFKVSLRRPPLKPPDERGSFRKWRLLGNNANSLTLKDVLRAISCVFTNHRKAFHALSFPLVELLSLDQISQGTMPVGQEVDVGGVKLPKAHGYDTELKALKANKRAHVPQSTSSLETLPSLPLPLFTCR
ncbi:hypothetical protein QQF64_006932 [Cirrhinus molitorella]|uniref:Uncharacterized protein n=1 Tax=Cirrhinus molitorella TaxID=172907 RepID=A0ABR3M981_9TELE